MKRKDIINYTIIACITCCFTLFMVELSYRFQWFDFYKAELNGLNNLNDMSDEKPNILICGDSFSADKQGYVELLRDSLGNADIINSSVPGTGIVQHAIILPKRIKKFKPAIFIYQFYVGNDFFDISHPQINIRTSLIRRLYWWSSERLLSLSYVNFRLAGFRYKFYDDAGGNYKPKQWDEYSPQRYSKREMFNYSVEPGLIENTLFLQNGRDRDCQIFKSLLHKINGVLPPNTQKYLIIIPHQSQLSELYVKRHTELGALYNHPIDKMSGQELPLYNELMILAEELNFNVIDPLLEFRRRDSITNIYYPNDPHLSMYGHQSLADIVKQHLVETAVIK